MLVICCVGCVMYVMLVDVVLIVVGMLIVGMLVVVIGIMCYICVVNECLLCV